MYVSLFPCNECAKLIIQSGIHEVVFESNKYKNLLEFQVSEKMLKSCGIKIRQIKQVNIKMK
jgi:dCMP deaminase